MNKYLDIRCDAFNEFVDFLERLARDEEEELDEEYNGNFTKNHGIEIDEVIQTISDQDIADFIDGYDKEHNTSFNNTIYGMLFNQLYDHHDMVEADEDIVQYNSDPSDFLYNKEEIKNEHRKHFNMDVIDCLDDHKAQLIRTSVGSDHEFDDEGYNQEAGEIELEEVKASFESIPFINQEVFNRQHEWLVTLNSDVKLDRDTLNDLESLKNKEVDTSILSEYTKDAFQPTRGDGSNGLSFNDQIDCLITQVKQKNPDLKQTKSNKMKI